MDWILVAAIIPHMPISWSDGQIVEGTAFVGIEDKQAGAQTILGLVLPYVTYKSCSLLRPHKLFGTVPKSY